MFRSGRALKWCLKDKNLGSDQEPPTIYKSSANDFDIDFSYITWMGLNGPQLSIVPWWWLCLNWKPYISYAYFMVALLLGYPLHWNNTKLQNKANMMPNRAVHVSKRSLITLAKINSLNTDRIWFREINTKSHHLRPVIPSCPWIWTK